MPLRELKHPRQVEAWLEEWGTLLAEPGSLSLIGFGGLLWHAAQRGIDTPLPENSMDPLEVVVPSVDDLIFPKLKRGESRDKIHALWAECLK
jgi:hypothetical protein